MTETFTQPASGSVPPEAPRTGGPSGKLMAVVGLSVVFLVAAVGGLGWVLGSSGSSNPVAPVKVTPLSIDVLYERPPHRPEQVCEGKALAYSGEQLIDGDENLGWGASKGDASGVTADMTFAGPVKLATVGLTPGYTRFAPRRSADCQAVEAFPYNRFVQSVRWTFDDGSSVDQRFDQRPEMQTMPVCELRNAPSCAPSGPSRCTLGTK